jgi:predicted Zn-dependent protease
MARSAFTLFAIWLIALPAEAAKLRGFVWDVNGESILVEGTRVELGPATRVERDNHPQVRTSDIRIGWEVEVESEGQGSDRVVAHKIKVKNRRFQPIKLEGFVERLDQDSIYTEGRRVHWPPGLGRDTIRLGMQLKGEGVLHDDGTVQLKKHELRPRERTEGEEQFLALASDELTKLKEKLVFYDDRLFQEYVNRVGQGLVPSYVDRDDLQFNFSIVDDPDLNAFALPDGTVVIHTGLLAVLENEAQLASVLGHEIAHVTHKHSYRGYRRNQKLQWVALGAAVAGAVIDAKSDRAPWQGPSLGSVLFSVGATLALSAAVSGHGRNLEDDADRIGLRYTVDSGYDPHQAPEVWRIFNRRLPDQNAAVNWFFSDHSTHRARISNLTREINQNYRGSLDPARLARREEEYQKAVSRMRRHNAIRAYERKNYRQAEEALRSHLQDNPDDAVAHLYLGNIYRDLAGNSGSKEAVAEYETAIRLDPELAEPYRELGFYYYGQGDHARARESFGTYLDKAPHAQDAAQVRDYLRQIPP